MRPSIALLAALALLAAPRALAWAGQTVLVTQEHRRFSADTLDIARGDVVRFLNADEFMHQITVKALGISNLPGEDPGQHVDIAFPSTGTFEVRCEIHPKMLLTVSVH